MILYTIFRNEELIWARNFEIKNKREGIKRLEKTLDDIKRDENISDIKFDDTKLEFTNIDEKHIMIVTE
ncbi:MAG: hypothetical protein ACI4VQ_02350 [Clostridia bacterium]